ncbi:3'-5' exonuclease [Coemansia javaensis]|uniref:RNA exonuclease 4 n=1 Tax=Coemansia javaensis TaxID=2761396 RepID=A0A9W8H311_9FUNG|nr:3'-5' exonuclease [Coemansia javaensis]
MITAGLAVEALSVHNRVAGNGGSDAEDVVVSFGGETLAGQRSGRKRTTDVDDIVDALLGGELEGARSREAGRGKKKARRKKRARRRSPSPKPVESDNDDMEMEEETVADLYVWESSGDEAAPAAGSRPVENGAEAGSHDSSDDSDAAAREAERKRTLELALAAADGAACGRASDMPLNEDEWFEHMDQEARMQPRRKARKREQPAQAGDDDDDDDDDDLPTDLVKAAGARQTAAATTTAAAVAVPREKREAAGKYLAIDCEMVGAGFKGSRSVLGRVSIVNFYGHTVLDTFVQPLEPVTDYRTWVSGIRREDLAGGRPFKEVQQQVADLVKDKVLIGHAIRNDLNALMLTHPPLLVRDTARYAWPPELAARGTALRKLAASVLHISIQQGEHSSVTDAKTTMLLYRKVKDDWERSLAPLRYKQQVRRAKTKERFARLRQEATSRRTNNQ